MRSAPLVAVGMKPSAERGAVARLGAKLAKSKAGEYSQNGKGEPGENGDPFGLGPRVLFYNRRPKRITICAKQFLWMNNLDRIQVVFT